MTACGSSPPAPTWQDDRHQDGLMPFEPSSPAGTMRPDLLKGWIGPPGCLLQDQVWLRRVHGLLPLSLSSFTSLCLWSKNVFIVCFSSLLRLPTALARPDTNLFNLLSIGRADGHTTKGPVRWRLPTTGPLFAAHRLHGEFSVGGNPTRSQRSRMQTIPRRSSAGPVS